jgi:hypothetical protein
MWINVDQSLAIPAVPAVGVTCIRNRTTHCIPTPCRRRVGRPVCLPVSISCRHSWSTFVNVALHRSTYVDRHRPMSMHLDGCRQIWENPELLNSVLTYKTVEYIREGWEWDSPIYASTTVDGTAISPHQSIFFPACQSRF